MRKEFKEGKKGSELVRNKNENSVSEITDVIFQTSVISEIIIVFIVSFILNLEFS